jgi:hypothetical protein
MTTRTRVCHPSLPVESLFVATPEAGRVLHGIDVR